MNNLDLMRKRLEFQGGIKQEDRMIKDKYRTFLKTLSYSYQGCDVQLIQPYTECPLVDTFENDNLMSQYDWHRALINPDKVKQDYDDKILSIEYNDEFVPGNVFQWIGTNSQWIIYLEQLTEDAYFRGEIRRCRWKIKFRDGDGQYRYTWAAIRGPVETAIDSIQKNQIRVNRPNWSLSILMPLNEYTKSIFNRYSRFLFDDMAWQVQAVNRISMTNILEVVAEEYYSDPEKDDIPNQVADGLVIEPVDPNPQVPDEELVISGETFIKPMMKNRYFVTEAGGCWSTKDKCPVKITKVDDFSIDVEWQKATNGQFTLCWKNSDTVIEKIVVVESLF